MCECVLCIRQLEGSHTRECLSSIVMEVLAESNLSVKFCAIMTDNASNNSTMMTILERELRPVNPHFSAKRNVLCMAHGINLEMPAWLNVVDVVQDKPESTFTDEVNITYLDGVVNGGETNVPSDISLRDVVQHLREVVRAIRGSTKQENKYFSYCRQSNMPNTRRIPLDCPTRWSFTYKMLHECLEKRIVINVMMSSAFRKPTLLDAEWDLVQKFVVLLKPLKDGTSIAIQSKAPTSNEAILIIKGLMRHLERIKVEISNSSMLLIRHSIFTRQRNALASVCGAMKVKLEKYVSILAHNEAFTISSLLDSSMKLRLIDLGSKNGILSTVRTIMESYSLTRDLQDVSVEISDASMRHEFLRAEMKALLDPFELPQRVGLMEELDLYATTPPPPSVLGIEVLHWWKTKSIHLIII